MFNKKEKYLTWDKFMEKDELIQTIEERGGSSSIVLKFNSYGLFGYGGSVLVKDIDSHFKRIYELMRGKEIEI